MSPLRMLPSFKITRRVTPLRARLPVQAGAWLCVGLGPIPRFARVQHCVLSCALRAGRSS